MQERFERFSLRFSSLIAEVDTLGLVLRVFVAAASVGEREVGKQVLQKVHRMDTAVSRLHTIWVDGGFDGEPFMQWVINVCRWIVQVLLRPEQTFMICAAEKTMGGATSLWLADGLGQTHLKYKNPLIARVSAFLNLAFFFVKILIQQGFQKSRAFALADGLSSIGQRL